MPYSSINRSKRRHRFTVLIKSGYTNRTRTYSLSRRFVKFSILTLLFMLVCTVLYIRSLYSTYILNSAYPDSLPMNGELTDTFGYRRETDSFHYGVDIAAPMGTPVNSAGQGIVTLSEDDYSNFGNTVIINHENGYETLYAHLDRRMKDTHDRVDRGETVGTCGSTGESTGTHLHFEVRYKGKRMNPLFYITLKNQ